MLRPTRQLSATDLDGIAQLERRVVAHDGGRLKLEWNRLRARDGDRAEDVLAFDGARLVGFAGLYGPGPAQIEIAGMVDPDYRRHGLGAALLDAAVALCAPVATGPPLLIVPRQSAGGRALAARRAATLDHSEHALVLRGEPVDGPEDPALAMRDANRADVADLLALLTDGFGSAPPDVAAQLHDDHTRTLVAQLGDAVVATLRINRDGERAAIYGFAVAARRRGRGIGRDVLRRTCHALRGDGVREIGLEVEVDNDRALSLYTSLGFAPVITEDYWAIAL